MKKIIIGLLLFCIMPLEPIMPQEVLHEVPQNQDPNYWFYHKNPWVFLEKILIENPEVYNSAMTRECVIKCAATALLIFYGGNAGAFILFGLLAPEKEQALIASCIVISIAAVALGVFAGIRHSNKQLSGDQKSLVDFFKNYHSDISKIILDTQKAYNNKQFIPQELFEMFDAFYKRYQQSGGNVSEADAAVFSSHVRQLIYRQNPNKYYKPVVNVTSYPVVINTR